LNSGANDINGQMSAGELRKPKSLQSQQQLRGLRQLCKTGEGRLRWFFIF
jgi:hypothetical protein